MLATYTCLLVTEEKKLTEHTQAFSKCDHIVSQHVWFIHRQPTALKKSTYTLHLWYRYSSFSYNKHNMYTNI